MSLAAQLASMWGLFLLFGVAELAFPAERGQPRKERIHNLVLGAGAFLLGGLAFEAALRAIPFSIPTRPPLSGGWAVSAVLGVLALFVWDVLFYWYHRAEHRFGWLWALHRFHHADAHLNATTALRHPWLETPIQAFLLAVPATHLLPLDAGAAWVFALGHACWLVFVHANWRLHLGPLSSVVGNPQVHRVHHSRLPEHRDKNFATFFPVIDQLFGTYYAPARNEFPPTGTPDLPSAVPFGQAALMPFEDWLGGKNRTPVNGPTRS